MWAPSASRAVLGEQRGALGDLLGRKFLVLGAGPRAEQREAETQERSYFSELHASFVLTLIPDCHGPRRRTIQ